MLGVTDDTDYLTALLAQPDQCHRLRGTYVVSRPLVLHRSSSLIGERAQIVFRDAGDGAFARTCLSCTGAVPTLLAASFTSQHGTDSAPAATQAGEMLCTFDPALSSYSSHRPYYHAGEFARVASPGRIVGAWLASYVGAQLYRYAAPARCVIEGVELVYEGPLTPCVLEITRGQHVSLRGVTISGSAARLCGINQTHGAAIDGCRFEQLAPDVAANGLNYGLVISNSQDVRVTNSTLIALRHAITTGGASYSEGVPVPVNRLIAIANCDLSSTFNVAALDIHGNTELWSVRDSRVHGGVDVGGNEGVVEGCTILSRDESQAGVAIYATEWTGCDHTIRNNTMRGYTTASYNSRAAIYLNIGDKTKRGGMTAVTGNRVVVSGGIGSVRGVLAHNSGSAARWGVNIVGNVLRAETPGAAMIKFLRTSPAAQFLPSLVADNVLSGGSVEMPSADFAAI